MDTVRVNIEYRPLRIAWAIARDDRDAFRQALRLTHCLWGGRFNPIVFADDADGASRMIECFRPDMIYPVGNTGPVTSFPQRFPYLFRPFYGDLHFVDSRDDQGQSQVLDIHNAVVHLRDTPEWRAMKDKGTRHYIWNDTDPLSDVFLTQFGQYPAKADTGIDYLQLFRQALDPADYTLPENGEITSDVIDYPSISFLARIGLRTTRSHFGWRTPGFFVGDANNLEDLVCHWNLRACNIPLWFIDEAYIERYRALIPAWAAAMQSHVSHRHEFERHVGVWYRSDRGADVRTSFGDIELMLCPVSDISWNGMNVRVPDMVWKQVSALGVVGNARGKPRVTFGLNDKPFSGDGWFHRQHVVASLSFFGLYGEEQHTLRPPYIPELNEFFAREMIFDYQNLRSEPEGIGVIVDVANSDLTLTALPVAELFEQIFSLAGLKTHLSNSGIILRQLIAHVGGLQGARVFKIPGVRRLLKTHGPTASFSRRGALSLIGGKDPENPEAKFSDHQRLFIEQRPIGTKLTSSDVFAHLVVNGLFRIGVDLECPSCQMSSWISVDTLRHDVECHLCGRTFDATRQLVASKWAFRRSGVFGAERNAQGAIPVALTLQQLDTNLSNMLGWGMYSPSLQVEAADGAAGLDCEVDFVWLLGSSRAGRPRVIIGECKDRGGTITDDDVANMKTICARLPKHRLDAYVIFAKLSAFTNEEIARAHTLNDRYRQRVILLTHEELEPYHIFDRTGKVHDIGPFGGTPEELAAATAKVYFAKSDVDNS